MKKTKENNIALCGAFIDYEKRSNSPEKRPVIGMLKYYGMYERYVRLLKKIYRKVTVVIQLHENMNQKIYIKKGKDSTSPKLPTVTIKAYLKIELVADWNFYKWSQNTPARIV